MRLVFALLAALLTVPLITPAAEAQDAYRIRPGDVLRIEATADGPLRPGQTVTIIVSRGPDFVTVPNVVGKTIEEGIQLLRDAGFRVNDDDVRTVIPQDRWGQGFARIASTDPAGGQQAIRGTRVVVRGEF